ncbi:hypothetical protein Hypma_002929 [Hypsizygus marmoreus]|uniref:Uncharacterized protein n=1 Tax=Hypsizygus marmoreus TaxID=39966 RepID=A0A369J324_HYPMA|nr:hypothetical protein Hypma_002929 [Hypsizygus marmoreus]
MKDKIFLPDLRSMAWARFHEDDHVFECLVAPSLKELHVFSWGVTEFSSLSTIQIFQYDSGDDLLRVGSSLEDILSGMPILVEFETSLEIPTPTLQKVLHGELLPFLEVMKCGVAFELADVFIDVFEKGLQNGAALRGRLREVQVQLTAMRCHTSPPESAMRHAERIMRIYGIDFHFRRGI